MAKSVIQTRLRQGPGPLLLRRLLERRPPHDGRRVALCRPVRRLPRRRPRLPAAAGGDRQHRRRARPTCALATTRAIRRTGFTAAERTARLERRARASATRSTARPTAWCRTRKACQAAFDLDRDVPTCTGARDGTCLSAAQKTAIAKLFSGATTSTGSQDLLELPVRQRAGRPVAGPIWKFSAPLSLRLRRRRLHLAGAADRPAGFNGPTFTLDRQCRHAAMPKIQATNATYTENVAVAS